MSAVAKFIEQQREELTERWLAKCRDELRSEQPLDDDELRDSLSFFIDELIAGLNHGGRLAETGSNVAQAHGAQRQVLQRDVADVVREYGLFFQCVVDACEEKGLPPFSPREYAMLSDCLGAGAAEAVREFAKLRDIDLRRQGWEHFAFLAHEIRNPLQTARLSATILRSGASERGLQSLERSLVQVTELLDRSLTDARLRGIDAGAAVHLEPADVRRILEAALDESAPDAEARHILMQLAAGPPVQMNVDVRLLRSAVTNLVRNAVKFTRSGGTVTVRGRPGLIEVEDECGGLRPGDEERIFGVFQQAGEDRSGFGLGLAIAQQAVHAHQGRLTVRNLPGKGCVFAVSLPT